MTRHLVPYNPATPEPGSALAAINSPLQRAWVLAKVETGLSHKECARLAGYDASTEASLNTIGWRLSRDPRVLAALHELASQRMKSSVPALIKIVEDIALDPKTDAKDRLTAIRMVYDRAGLPAQTQHTVEVRRHDTKAQLVTEIVEVARRLDMDPIDVLVRYGVDPAMAAKAAAGQIMDADFEEVEASGDSRTADWALDPEQEPT